MKKKILLVGFALIFFGASIPSSIAYGAISFVQKVDVVPTVVSPVVVNFASTTAGDTLVVWAAWQSTASTMSVTDSAGDVFTVVTSTLVRDTTNGASMQMAYATNIHGGGTTTTIDFSATSFNTLAFVAEYRGIASVNALDQGIASNTSSSFTHVVGPAAPSVPNELAIAVFFNPTATSLTWTPGSGYLERSTTTPYYLVEDQTFPGTSSILGDATTSIVIWTDQAMVTFQPPPPILAIATSTSFAFTALHGATATSSQSLVITNSGAGNALNWSATSTASWLTFSANSGTLAAGASSSLRFIVDPSALTVGTYNATATISDPAATGSPQNIPATLAISSTGASVSITSPAAGATVSGTTSIAATATSTAGVSSVQFLLDGATLGSPQTSTPYVFSWNTTSASGGSHVLSASTTDALGNSATSSPVAVTVSNGPPLIVSVPGGYIIGSPPGVIPGQNVSASAPTLATIIQELIASTSTPSAQSMPSNTTIQERIAALQQLVLNLRAQIVSLQAGGTVPAPSPALHVFVRDLQLWDFGDEVTMLQRVLIKKDSGPAARALAAHGVSTIFGTFTYRALKEYQAAAGIPATGFFGPITRSSL